MSANKPPFDGECKRVKLNDIAVVKASNVAPKKGDFSKIGTPFVRAGSLTSLLAGGMLSDLELIDEPTAQKLRMTLFPEGTVVFAKSGMSCMTGNVYVLPEPCYVVSHLACVIPVGDYAVYLKHYFRSNRPSKLVENPSFPSIRLSKIQNMELEIPVRLEMEKQVRSLEHIESLIEWSKEQIAKLDTLVKSRFVEMFGGSGWPVATVGSLATDIRYGTSKKASDSGQFVYLRMNNMTDGGGLDFDDVKYIDLDGSELDKCLVVDGDLLFNRTNSREKVGKTAVFHEKEPMVIAGYIIRVRLGDRIRPDFLAAYMNLPTTKAMLRSIARGAVHQANINSKELSAIEVPVPPICLQDSFLAFVAEVDKSRFNLLKAYGSIIALFRVLFP